MSCLRDDELERMVRGTGASEWQAHVDGCPQCRERLKTIHRNMALEAELRGPSSSADAAVTMDYVKSVWQHALTADVSPETSIKLRPTESGRQGAGVTPSPRRLGDKDHPQSPVDYELLEILGRGGMGVVYEARQTSIDRSIALKMISDPNAESPEQRDFFVSEAAVMGNLDHPNIVPVHDLGTDEKGRLFYSMKHVRGKPWSELVKNQSLRENLDVLLRVSDAVAFAHHRGVIHRDLKPENVMLGEFGEVLLIDWGLAAAVSSDAAPSGARTVDSRTAACGTPAYMAPEMAQGLADRIGPLSDVYLLGAILFEIVTGERLHGGETTLECLHNAAQNVIRPADPDHELVRVALKATATSPADRYATVRDFQDAIREHLEHLESVALADRARGDLAAATEQQDTGSAYDRYAHAVFGFRAALEMWADNAGARSGLSEASRQYAAYCFRNGDLDRALSLLDPDDSTHAELIGEVSKAIDDRDQREQRLKEALEQVEREHEKAEFELYISHIQLAQKCWEEGRTLRMEELLDNCPRRYRDWEWGMLHRLLHLELVELTGHEKGITSISFSPDGQRLATASPDGTVRLWNPKTGHELERMSMETGWGPQLAFSADGGMLAVGGGEGEIRICDAKSLKVMRTLCGAEGQVTALAFSPDGRSLVAALGGGVVGVWNVDTGEKTSSYQAAFGPGRQKWITSLAFSPDGESFATVAWDNHIRLWNARTTVKLRDIEWVANGLTSVCFSSDGRHLAVSGNTGRVRVLNAKTWELEREMAGHTGRLLALACSPDGSRIASAGDDMGVSVWNAEKGERLFVLRGHRAIVESLAFSPDGTKLGSSSQDGTIRIWDATADREALSIDPAGGVRDIDISPDGSKVAGCGGIRVCVWDTTTGEALAEMGGHTGSVGRVVFSPDGANIASSSRDGTVRIWDVASANEQQVLPSHGKELDLCGYIERPAFSPDGSLLAAAGDGFVVRVWNLKDPGDTMEMSGHPHVLADVDFSPDGAALVSCGEDNTVRIRSIETQEILLESSVDGGPINACFSPDGTRLAYVSGPEVVVIRDLATGKELFRLVGHNMIRTVRYSSLGTRIITSDILGVIRLWDAGTGREIVSFRGTSPRFSANGLKLAFLVGETPHIRIHEADPWWEPGEPPKRPKPVHVIPGSKKPREAGDEERF